MPVDFMQDPTMSAGHAAIWRRLAARVAELRSRWVSQVDLPAPSPASAWLEQVAQACPPPAPVLRTRSACLTQSDYAQDTASRARALLLADAASALVSVPNLKKTATRPQVPPTGTDSSGKE